MRDDMDKVLVERERHGVRGAAIAKRRNRRRFNDPESFEDARKRGSAGSGRQYGYHGKSLNENLTPLRRFLESQVGRPWDAVYSELREHVSPRNAVQAHVLQHVEMFIDIHGSDHDRPHRWPRRSLYVNDAGIVCRRRRRKKSASRATAPGWESVNGHESLVDGDDVYVKIAGIWYQALMSPVPEGRGWGRKLSDNNGTMPLFDIVLQTQVHWHRADQLAYRRYGRLDLYASGHGKQLSSRQLRRLGVTNGYD